MFTRCQLDFKPEEIEKINDITKFTSSDYHFDKLINRLTRDQVVSNDAMKLLEQIVPRIFLMKYLQVKRVTYSKLKIEIEQFLAIWEDTAVGENLLEWSISFEDLKYESAVMDLSSEYENDASTLPYLGFFEEIINSESHIDESDMLNKLEKLKMKDDLCLLKSIRFNYNIREKLCKDVLVGVVGLKKSGKSTFVEVVAETRWLLSHRTLETSTMAAFSIDSGKVLIDYPHQNTEQTQYLVQYMCSRYLLNFLFAVCDVREVGLTATKYLKKLFETLKIDSVWRVCVVFNKVDRLMENEEDDPSGKPNDPKNPYGNIREQLANAKTVLINMLKDVDKKKGQVIDQEDYNKVRFIDACLDPKAKKKPEVVKLINALELTTREDLKKKTFNIINELII